jgi:hypothetical protein
MVAPEMAINRRNTVAFITANPVIISLTPRARINSGTGARWAPGVVRDPQQFRLVDQSSTSGPVPGRIVAADGVQRQVQFQLLGAWDSLIGLWDFWRDEQGILFEVAELLPWNGYEQRAKVVRYGE